ncbi:hypothetical protein [Nonomuraea sp. NPDC049725]|uniref:hypothetical protein n=1 Tax=Nonomuraea sp. NPDC049725 TaxID=3154508 RepID=UPI00343048EE
MNATTALLVDGAFLLLDGALTAQQGDDVVNSVLLARHVAAQTVASDAGGYADALCQALGNIGWTSTDIATHSTQLAAGSAPLTSITGELAKLAPGALVDELVTALEGAGPAARQAWKAPPGLLMIARLDSGVPVLAYDYSELTPAEPASGYPSAPLTEAGTLAQFTGSAAMNRMVFTTAFSQALAAKVAPMRKAAVIPLRPEGKAR